MALTPHRSVPRRLSLRCCSRRSAAIRTPAARPRPPSSSSAILCSSRATRSRHSRLSYRRLYSRSRCAACRHDELTPAVPRVVVFVRLRAIPPRRRRGTDRAAAQAADAPGSADRRCPARRQTRPRAGRVPDLLDSARGQPDVAAHRLARLLSLRVHLRVGLRPVPGHAHARGRGLASQGRGLRLAAAPVM